MNFDKLKLNAIQIEEREINMKKGESILRSSPSNALRKKIPSPQDPFPVKSLHIAIPHVNVGSPEPSSPIPIKNTRSSPITPTKTGVLNQSQTIFQLGSPSADFKSSFLKNKNTRVLKEDVNFEDFFSSLSARNYIHPIEVFFASNLNSKTVIYWEEISSIQRLISEEIRVSVSHSESLVGFAFLQRKIVTIPVAHQHKAYDTSIDGNIAHPNSFVIFIPLLDYKNNTVALIEVIKNKTDARIMESEQNFINLFQAKFRSYSQYLLESRNIDDLLFSFMKYRDTTQFILNFHVKMEELFDTFNSEIWVLSNKNEKPGPFQLYKKGDIIDIPVESSGIVSDILKKDHILNCANSRLMSSYISEIDGLECPILGIPFTVLQYTIIILLRGRKTNLVFSSTNENLLARISPFISAGFVNTFNSNSESDNNIIKSLIESLPSKNNTQQSNFKILSDFMERIISLTEATRATYYEIDKGKLISIFHSGLKQSISIPLGQGHAGISAQKGIVINVADAHNDPQFNNSIDDESGFKTTSLLTVPIFSNNGSVVSVVQVLNKKSGFPFSNADINFCVIFGTICRLMLDNSSLCGQLNELKRKNDILDKSLISVTMQPTSENLIDNINESIKILMRAESCESFIYQELDGIFSGQTTKLNGKKGSAFYCFDKKSGFYVNSVQNDLRTIDEENDFTNICIVPLITRPNGEAIGVLRAINKSQAFDDNDLNLMQIFSSIISLLVCEKKLTRYIDMTTTQIAAESIINPSENGLFTTPTKFKLQNEFELEKMTDINFYSVTFDNQIRIIFYAFESLGLMKEFKIKNNILLCFILNVQKHYFPDKPFHNFVHACDMCQFLLYMFRIVKTVEFIPKEELLVFLVACIGSYMKTDEKDNSFHKRMNTSIALLFDDKPIERNKCAKMLNILDKSTCNLFEYIDKDKKKNAWSLLFDLLLLTNYESIIQKIQSFERIVLESTIQLNNTVHRHAILSIMFIICQYAFLARDLSICKDWLSRQKEELFMLGDLEKENNLPYSSEFNNRESKKKFDLEISIFTQIGVPLMKVFASLFQEVNDIKRAIDNNLEAFKEAEKGLNDIVNK